ncbi:MFS transporter, partial [Burkholderia thailandensis]|nr:MFS transporter [Burkholderia thailandensis]
MAISFLHVGTNPTLSEAFPRSTSTANILLKASDSGGQFLLPIIIGLLVWANMWFGWSFLLAGAIMLINGLFLLRCPFPPYPGRILKPKISQAPVAGVHHCSLIDLISYTLYGYISMATLDLISQWLAQYGQF